MISVAQAKHELENLSYKVATVQLPLLDAVGKTLAQDVFSAVPLPHFSQSGMDGYAFAFDDFVVGRPLELCGQIAAGSLSTETLPKGKTVRIFTGAPVPAGADTVVMQEKTEVINQQVHIHHTGLKKGENVRMAGSSLEPNQLVLQQGSMLSPAAIGLLSSVGCTSVEVYAPPSICLIATGNELQQPGVPLQFGQIYDSNTQSLIAALQGYGLQVNQCFVVPDEMDPFCERLAQALDAHDLIVITGGVSVGDYDYTVKAAEKCGVETVFHKIAQKPGKPLFIGNREQKIVVGLPGNPSSVLTCFYEYVTIILSNFTRQNLRPVSRQVKVNHRFTKPAGLTQFLKAYHENNEVNILDAQESYKLSSFALANCFVVLPSESEGCVPGDEVEIHIW